jgi:hypothetical protein
MERCSSNFLAAHVFVPQFRELHFKATELARYYFAYRVKPILRCYGPGDLAQRTITSTKFVRSDT